MISKILDRISCCSYEDLMPDIPNDSVSLVFTDPPFGVNYLNTYTKSPHKVMTGDETNFSYHTFGKHAFRILKDNSALFAFTGWSTYPIHFLELEECGFELKEPLICQKRASGNLDLKGSFQSNADWCLFAHKERFVFKETKLLKNKRAGTVPNKGRKAVPEYKTRFPSCWFGPEYPFSSENSSFQAKHNLYHPTIKGQKFAEWVISISTEEGDTVVDPFCGTGTIAVAAKKLKRHFIACDISEKYCTMAEKRLSNANL
jgi:site-specific DNA-methyltransferase (adenine-specific)